MQAAPSVLPAILLALLLALRLLCFSFLNYCLRRCQPCDWHTERRRADVVHAYFVAELDAWRISTMFAADTDLQLRANGTSAFSRPTNQKPNAVDVQSLEWIIGEDTSLLLIHILGKESTGIVTRKSHAHLREIVCAEGKEFRDFCNLIRQKCSPRNFDHRANHIVKFYLRFLQDLLCHLIRPVGKNF